MSNSELNAAVVQYLAFVAKETSNQALTDATAKVAAALSCIEVAPNQRLAKVWAAGAKAVPSDEAIKQAEALKAEGNALLGKGDNAGAAEKYGAAIKLNPTNAIYFSNRAAALINLGKHSEAIPDCEASIAIDATYLKSFYRLGQCRFALKEYEAAKEAFEAALKVSTNDPAMAKTIKEQLELVENALADGEDEEEPETFNQLNAMNSGMGGAGGMDMGGLLNNPMLSNLMNSPEIANIMNNPQFQNMVKNMDIGSLMGGMGGAGGMPGAGRAPPRSSPAPRSSPEVDTNYRPSNADLFDDKPTSPPSASSSPQDKFAEFLASPAGQKAMQDPDLSGVINDVKKNGPSAAMKYMGNPKVMAKLQTIIGPLMGGK